MLVEDKVQKKSFIINVEFKAQYDSKLRMDVFSPLGTHEASLVLRGSKVRYLLMDRRQAFMGEANNKSLGLLITVPVHPVLLYSILFDRPIELPDWSCERDENNHLKRCENSKSELVLRWQDRLAHRKNVFIEHPSADVQIRVLEFAEKVPDLNKAFRLRIPSAFKRYKLN